MRLGFSTVMYEGSELSYSEIVAKASAFGYDGTELNFREWPTCLDIGKIKESLGEFNVEVAAVGTRHLYVTHGLYLGSPSKTAREKALAYVTECMKIARELNCSLVQAGWAFQGSMLETSYDIAWRQAVESLKETGRRALEYEVDIAIEFACRQNAQLVNTMDDALRMLDDVGSPSVLVMADVFHIHAEGEPLRETVLKAGERLAYVHLSDSDRLPPGMGEINFREFISALEGIGYNGYLTMEFDPGPQPDESVRRAAAYIRRFL